jgi:threonylcarbamoyladenosine tRNA methylthiotransferase MtaB
MTRDAAAVPPDAPAAAAPRDVIPPGSGGGRIAFHTFGCKLNQYETEALASSLRAQGFAVVPASQEADAYIVNTCTVTTRADHKARSMVRSLARRHTGALILVTGCSAQLEAGRLAGLAENIVVIPQAEKAIFLDLAALLSRMKAGGQSRVISAGEGSRRDPFALTAVTHSFHTRASLKIQDGCDAHCTYCRVPLARGPSTSLLVGEAVRRAGELERQGYREIVVTGVNISAWQSGDLGLESLLGALLRDTRHARYRLSSLEPEKITDSLAVVLEHPRICPHFHIPVQSGADTVLGRMRRPYGAIGVADAVRRLRSAKHDPFLAADIIVGFPGESAEDFSATRCLVESLGFAALHVFPFSPRPGTAAASLRPVVAEHLRFQRTKDLMALSRRSTAAYVQSWIGSEAEVLVEGRKGGAYFGVTGNYLKVTLEDAPSGRDITGQVARAGITESGSARFLSIAE